jgi:hypothetical protein
MNGLQEHVSPYPPFQSVPVPRNEKEAHIILVIVIITWMVGFTLILRQGRKNK